MLALTYVLIIACIRADHASVVGSSSPGHRGRMAAGHLARCREQLIFRNHNSSKVMRDC